LLREKLGSRLLNLNDNNSGMFIWRVGILFSGTTTTFVNHVDNGSNDNH
jgi:hypothetical protein